MKFLIASDIHGSAYYTQKVLSLFEKEKADKLILLGDIYNHGPRNVLPKDYNPMQVAELLNGVKEKLIVIKGNCDSQVDTMISEFDFVENTVIVSGGKCVFLTHGHEYNKDKPTKTKFDGVIYGHFHTGFIIKKGGTTYVNAGSTSLPKEQTPNSYLTLEEGVVTLKDIEGKVIATEKI
jgi:putative phosphoesterase